MSRRIQAIVGIVAVALIGLLFWPIFIEGEPILPISLAAFLVAGVVLAYFALKSQARWARYALLGVIPGFFIGGFGLGLLVWSTGSGDGGWEELVAVVAGILGAFIGAVIGAVCGGILGYRKDRRERVAG